MLPKKKLSSKCIEFVWRVLPGVTHSFHSFPFFWTSCKSLIFQNIVFVPRFTVMHWLLCQKVQKLTPLTFCLHLRKIPDWKAATRNTYFWKTNTLHMHLLVDKNESMKAIKACNQTKKAIEAWKPLRLAKTTSDQNPLGLTKALQPPGLASRQHRQQPMWWLEKTICPDAAVFIPCTVVTQSMGAPSTCWELSAF